MVIGGPIAGTIHDGETVYGPYLFIDGPANTPITKSIRYTTAGYQVAAFAGISMIRTKSHELQVRVGALARFQSAQNYDGGGVQAIMQFVLSETRYVLLSNDGGHQRSYTLGYLAQLIYTYTFNEKYSIGLQAGMQNDQQGDVITQYGLVIGRRF